MALPAWWSSDLPDLVSRRDSMPSVDRWQTSYVRYKTQPEAYVCQAGWELATSRKFAEKLAQEESAFTEDTLLYNGLAPCKVSLRIVDAPAEYAVPVKQDRRLTPNFKVRVDVQFQDRCSFPLTLKAYIISQQEKDSVPEWVPEDFLDPDAPPQPRQAAAPGAGGTELRPPRRRRGAVTFCPPSARKPITELKGNVCVTHNFDGSAEDHVGGLVGCVCP
ncbi:hypothetical protein MNEG_13073 [Monoraphidium neglectum]|uniref:Uncharacterized protein n=1 Tax=Monoraphidium neglectum TaxID=145388 RepID=A0A0D2MIQ6_9CHLO|nr:hypothetical protein MNEG_13073 [Monoraphidium neglectum]KIY94890.1 hypothetical protein MNEG_13073 [Monoraphidium neglectum]|eukprot:XP_013893910.1 hypothetical protein MNEG_13073 [Monoraphidium neglectum]